MFRHLLKRFLLTLPALWPGLTLALLMIHIVPGDPQNNWGYWVECQDGQDSMAGALSFATVPYTMKA